MTTASDVAVTIRDQIRAGDVKGCQNGTHAMMCWGFKNPMCETDKDGLHSLIFSVNGFMHKGKVKVKLMGNDTYTILTYKARQKDWVEVMDNVYCEDLAQILDDFIEG